MLGARERGSEAYNEYVELQATGNTADCTRNSFTFLFTEDDLEFPPLQPRPDAPFRR